MMPADRNCYRCGSPLPGEYAHCAYRFPWDPPAPEPLRCSWITPRLRGQLRQLVIEESLDDPAAPEDCGQCGHPLRKVTTPHRNCPEHPLVWKVAAVCLVCHAVRSVGPYPVPAPRTTRRWPIPIPEAA